MNRLMRSVLVLVAVTLVLMVGVGELRGDGDEKEPWLEYRHLSRAPLSGYTELLTPDGETYYSAATAFLDPIGFADVVPTSKRTEVTVVLTTGATKRFRKFTSEHVGELMGIFVDGELVRGPITINSPRLAPRRVSETLPADVCDALVQAWSARIDTRPGRQRLHIQGLGTIKIDLRRGAPGDLQFLHNGSLYGLPLAFATRPELNPKKMMIQEVVIHEDSITAGDKRFATVQEALAYVKKKAGPDKLLLVTISKLEADKWSKERLTELMPLVKYVHSNPPYVGFRQRMPEGWAWPTRENK